MLHREKSLRPEADLAPRVRSGSGAAHDHADDADDEVATDQGAAKLWAAHDRDANGVHAGAHDAVDAAAGESGAALPDSLRGQFEHSLGTELSGVRVHTGPASQQAAAALGANAYAQGQNIHFNAGQYDPSSATGQHLIAHEVAHTVQQANGTAQQPQRKAAVSSPGDAHEVAADRAADAMVRGQPASVGPIGGAPQVLREKTSTNDKAAANDDTVPPLTQFQNLLNKKSVSEKAAVAAWASVTDKTSADEATVVLAIQKLTAASAYQVLKDSNKGFTNAIVDAILKAKNGWHDQLKGIATAIGTAPDTSPMHRLADLVKASKGNLVQGNGYKPKLSDAPANGTTLAVGKPAQFTVSDVVAVDLHNKKVPEQPTFSWKATGDEAVFGPQPMVPDPATATAATVTYPVTPKKAGPTTIVVEMVSAGADGLFGKDTRSYTLSVIDAAADPNGYFEAKFKESFRQVVDTDAFKDVRDTKDAIANLFTPAQQTSLLGWMDTKMVPKGLFTESPKNLASGSQRVMIAAHMLTYGKIALNKGDVDGPTWAASCCGGWVNGVYAYAGVNFAKGYGVSSAEQSISPTGEKSYGSADQGAMSVANPNNDKKAHPEIASALSTEAAEKKQIATDEKFVADQAKAGVTDSADVKAAKEEIAKLKGDLAALQVSIGSSPNGQGAANMPWETIKTLKIGDWVYLDNNGAAGHSVIFAGWDGDEKTVDEPATSAAIELVTKRFSAKYLAEHPEILEAVRLETSGMKPRSVTYRACHVYNQPNSGGEYSNPKLGFPESRALGVDGVYSIMRVSDDAKPASSIVELLAFDLAKAKAANQKIIDGNGLDAGAVKKKLVGIVQAEVNGLKGHLRPDKVGKVSDGLSVPQQALCDSIIKGGDDDQTDIANLVALGQKLSVIDVVQGDPTHADGKLDTKISGGKWATPWPAWKSDTSLKKP